MSRPQQASAAALTLNNNNNDNNTKTPTNDAIHYSQLLALAERAAGSFGCDIQQLLLRSSAAAPTVMDAPVACSPGGRRSSRAIEENAAKTRTALAKALADVLLGVLWQGKCRDGEAPLNNDETSLDDDESSNAALARREDFRVSKLARAHTVALLDSQPDSPLMSPTDREEDPLFATSLGPASLTARQSTTPQQQPFGSASSAQQRPPLAPPASWESSPPPRQLPPPKRPPTADIPTQQSPSGGRPLQPPKFGPGQAKPALWLPPPQHPPSSEPQRQSPPQQGPPQAEGSGAGQLGASPLLPAHSEGRSGVSVRSLPLEGSFARRRGSESLSFVGGPQKGDTGSGGSHGGARMGVGQPTQQQLHASFFAAADESFRSAFVTNELRAFASSVAPQTVTMASFLKNVDSVSTVSAATGGAVNLSSDIPIEFTATHKANQARASNSNRWVLNGRYEFISRIGSGGQGAVWRVADIFTGQPLAIKIVPRGKLRSNRRRFSLAAARSSAGLGLLAGDPGSYAGQGGGGNDGDDDNDDNAAVPPPTATQNSGPSAASQSQSLPSGQGGGNDDDDDDDNAAAPPTTTQNSGPGAFSYSSRSFPSSTSGALAHSSLLDGSALLANSTGVLRLFYGGGLMDGGALPESLAMEIVMGLFRHPHTVPLLEVIDDPSCNNVFLVMPLAKPLPFSLNLASGHLTAAPPPIETILGYAKGAASALAVFHAAGIVHCDIKLDNLLLLPGPLSENQEDILAIADFGVCQLSVSNGGSQPQPADGHISLLGGGSGTLAYWAPECFAAKKQTDTFTAASDCYALGLCLYAMAFGRFPYWTPDVSNPLSWEKAIPGTARYTGTASAVAVPVPTDVSSPQSVLNAIIRGLLAPAADERMSASSVVLTLL